MNLKDLTDPQCSYYRDNLLAVFEALQLLGAPTNTGDWYGEVLHLLQEAGADASRANRSPRKLALDIYRAARDANVLDVLSLIDADG